MHYAEAAPSTNSVQTRFSKNRRSRAQTGCTRLHTYAVKHPWWPFAEHPPMLCVNVLARTMCCK